MSDSNDSYAGQRPDVAALLRAFDGSAITFKNQADALVRYKSEGREVTFNEETQTSMTVFDGQEMPFSEALRRWAIDNKNDAELLDRRTLPREGGGGRPGIQSRADFSTPEEKSAYIAQHGLDSWMALPSTTKTTSELKTFEDWLELPIEVRAELTAKHGPHFSATLPRRPKVDKLAENRQRLVHDVRSGAKLKR